MQYGKTNCPHCGRLNDCHSTTDDAQPSEGDVSLCWKCGGIAVFTENGDVRAPTSEEETELSRDPDVKKFRYAIHKAITPSEAIKMVNNG